MTKLACRICVIVKGITTQDLFDTQDDLEAHYKAEHDLPTWDPQVALEYAWPKALKILHEGLLDTINAHGPIGKENVGSAVKRIKRRLYQHLHHALQDPTK